MPPPRRDRHLHPAVGGQASPLLLGPLRRRRRGPCRGPDLHLLEGRGRRRPHQQLARSRRDAGHPDRPLPGLDAGTDHVRRPLLDGPPGVAYRPHRRRDHRLALRGRLHEDHDPDGDQGPGGPRSRRGLRPLSALGRCPPRAGPGRLPLALRRRQQVHRPLPRDPRDLVLRFGLRGQRPAREEMLRPAHRLGHGPRRHVAGRAHAHLEDHLARGRRPLHLRRLPVSLRQDQPGHARPHHSRMEGGDDRRRHLLDEVRPRRPSLRHQPRSGLLRGGPRDERQDESQRHEDARRQLHLHQHGPHPRRRRLVGGDDRRPAAGA